MSLNLFKETLIVSSMTLISRLLGFVRDLLIARLFGVSIATDAFFVAFKLPNFFRRLFAEGALTHVLVPVLSDYQKGNNAKQIKNFIAIIMGNLAVFLVLLTAIGMIIAPLLISLLAPGFAWQSEPHQLAVSMLRICLPYLAFTSFVALSGAILNAYQKFALTALTPALLNIAMIIAAVWFAPLMSQPITALAWSVFAAGLLQMILQTLALWRLKLLPRPKINFQNNHVKELSKKVLPAVFSVSVTQINLLLDTLIASFLTAGSVSWLYYSDRLVEFPVGILGLALSTVILPKLAQAYTENNAVNFSKVLDWGLRLVILIGTPATLGLILLAKPLLFTLFQYREFSANDVTLSAQSLCAYSIGLLGYIGIKILVGGFSARHDIKTPVRYGVYSMVISLLLNILAIPFAHAGLALATSLGAIFNAVLLLRKLLNDKYYKPAHGWRLFLLRVILANSIMSALLYYGVNENLWLLWNFNARLLHLIQWLFLAIMSYTLTLYLSGLRIKHFLL